ncbi:MAG: cytochrome C oxidase subunit IV family protein [Aigarchaeota archaeon]|nr:cytochrome C oxidase subunit IV family protein [Aigarchaeota archaeon]MCS7126880.1 cytochrome C oxidase subunit IV family protein [Candidatus Calditenuaceae archaeon]MCX8202719.1 cytochrome C oxidase subunit IV family protein [Nitrososphaeria archaeon]MDW8043981.1 cytochrome C oxidase subunit IV family protein [Nitrososphaerota archaeon]
MARTWIYLAVFGALVALTVLELVIFFQPLPRAVVDASIVLLAGGKAALIALFFMHLAYEPRSLASLSLLGIGAVVAFLLLSVLSLIGVQLIPIR